MTSTAQTQQPGQGDRSDQTSSDEAGRAVLVPPVECAQCCTCGGGGLDSVGHTCPDCSGLGLCTPGGGGLCSSDAWPS
jgi:hypothetical protein